MYQKWKRRSVLLSNNKTRKSLNSAPHALGSDLFIENTDFLTLFALINAQVWPLDPLCYFRISESHNQWLQSGQWLSQGISVLMSAPRVSLWQFSILRKQELHWQLLFQPLRQCKKPRSSWVQVSQCKSSGCSNSMSDRTPDPICKRKPTKLANLALCEPWIKPHSLGPRLLGLAALWCAQR